MGEKPRRQALLAELIESGRFRTQDELAEELARRNVPATAATVSRDLKELGYVKSVGGAYTRLTGAYPGVAPATGSETMLRRLLSDLPLEIEQAGNLLVLKTLPGYAHSVAAGIDACQWSELAGTVAGDDTIFLALRDPASGETVRGRIFSLAGEQPSAISRQPSAAGGRASLGES